MADKVSVCFLLRSKCDFVHRQKTNEQLVLLGTGKSRVWFEYGETIEQKHRKSVLCIYREIDIKSAFILELQAAARGEIEPQGFEFTPDVEKHKNQRFDFPSGMSRGADDRLSQIKADMNRYADNLVTNLRWRLDLAGAGKPFSAAADFFWSEDGKSWHLVPSKLYGYPVVQRDIIVENLNGEVISLALENERNEPVAHVLFRGAWSQRLGDHKSS